jgi:hypothetical protein
LGLGFGRFSAWGVQKHHIFTFYINKTRGFLNKKKQKNYSTSLTPEEGLSALEAGVDIEPQAKGRQKKNIGDPRGGLVGRSTKKDKGGIYFFDIFVIVFLNSPHRETPKNVIKIFSRKSRFWIFGRIFCNFFST